MADLFPVNSSRNRRHTSLASSPWTAYFGDLKALEDFLDSKSGFVWLFPKFLDSLLRGIGQVAFANNPVTGLVILLVFFFVDVFVGLAALLAATVAILTALLMNQETSAIRSGLTTFNAVLVGCITASLWKPLFDEPLSFKLWIFIALGGSLSVLVASGLGNILGKWSLPGLTLPFNVVVLLLFVCLMPPPRSTTEDLPTNSSKILENLDQENEKTILWGNVVHGVFCSMGEVFGMDSLVGSILIYFGMLVFSPCLCLMSFVGALVGTLSGLLFSGNNYGPVYAGIWGYNGLLSASSIGGFFFPPNWQSTVVAIANVIFTVLIQHALALSFKTFRLPVFTLPFVLSTLIFLSVTSSSKALSRVTNISFPEMHRHDYIESLKDTEAPTFLSNIESEKPEKGSGSQEKIGNE